MVREEARKVLDAGTKAQGGLDALREIRDVWREATGTGYGQAQSQLPDNRGFRPGSPP